MAKFCCYLMPDCGIDPLFCYHSDVKTEVAGDHFWSNIGTMGNRELLPMAVPAVTGVELIPIGKSERGREISFSRKIRERGESERNFIEENEKSKERDGEDKE